MAFRIVALDLDGTALDTTSTLRQRTKAAVAATLARGVEVVLVTGRHHVAVRAYHAELGLSSPAICCNGTYVYDFAGKRVLAGDPIGKDDARHILAVSRRHDVHAWVYTDECMTYETVSAHVRRLCAWAETLPPDVRPDLRRVDSFERVIEDAGLIWKFLVSHDDPQVLEAWRSEAADSDAFSIEYSWRDRLDVVRAGNTKGQRLIEWAATRGITPSEIIAFGDNHNDLTMLRSVGLGVAMGNGEDVVKAAAARVIGDNCSDDIAETIESLVL